jgi:hypothetical protein
MAGRSLRAAREVDGRYARIHAPRKPVTDAFLIAQWVKEEAVRLHRIGMDFRSIATELTAAGRGCGRVVALPNGQAEPLIPLPEGVNFAACKPLYSISHMGVYKAFKEALKMRPRFELDEMRAIAEDRLERLWAALQRGINAGNPIAIGEARRLLHEYIALNGLAGPARHEVEGFSVEALQNFLGIDAEHPDGRTDDETGGE